MPILHDGAASALLLWRVWVVALVNRAPAAWHHEVLGLLVREGDEVHSGLRDWYPSPGKVFLQPLVQLCKPPKLQLGH